MLPAPAPTLVRSALDLVGGGCHGCGAPEHPACRACLGPLAAPRAVRPDPPPPGLPAVLVAAGAYEGGVRALLVAHKERGRLALARPLGAALAAAVRVALAAAPGPPAGGPVVLVPVPSRPGSARRRGHDPLLRLARVAAIRLRRDGADGADIRVAPVLRVQRRLLDQAGLDTAARWANLGGALAVPPALAVLVARARVVVVDDVVTTGATLAEATRALRAVGCAPAAAAVVAATPRRGLSSGA